MRVERRSLGMFKGHKPEGDFSHVHCSEDNAGIETFIINVVQGEQARGRFFRMFTVQRTIRVET
jgi:hypothetical protein